MITPNGSCADYRCLSTDAKPNDAGENALLLEVDTGDFYYFSDGVWAIVGGGDGE